MSARPGGALADDLRGEVRGDVWFDRATRAVYATDASNYRQVPLGVVCPRDADDVAAALRVAAAHDVPVTARGAGTSLAGQSVNVGIILDTSRHMRAILEVDPERRIARVQPGVVLDDLRRETERVGLTFGPDPATHAWCTIGGMLGNDSCGTHALVAGKTGDNVERLRVVTYGGEALDVGAYADAPVDGPDPLGGRLAALRALVGTHEHDIRTGFPTLERRVSGMALDRLLPEQGVHVARSLVGTEGTCVTVTEATLRLVHIPAHRRLVVLGYRDVFEAADAVPGLLEHPLQGLEGLEQTLVDQMRARPLHVEHLPLLPEGRAWLYAELAGDTPDEADAVTSAFTAALPAGQVWRRFDDRGEQARLWLIRESGLGATAIRADGTHNLEGWEDAAVPPERLGEYLRRLTALWGEFGYSGALYGHFGQGCVHTRNDFDLHSAEGRARYRAFVERAADLVVSLGGSISGEHGDGQSRGELLSRMYGPGLMDAFRAYKAVWDPRGRMNPGKLIDARPLDEDLRSGAAWKASALATERPGGFALARDHGSLQAAAERCVGVGRCRRDDAGVMCPSFRATRVEEHSTRGRAKLLAELFQGDATPEDWRNDDVREALDLCLSCKGCKVDCPTGVDVATYKAEFLHHHYRHRLRPRAAYLMGSVPLTSRIATRMPRLVNGVLRAPGLGRLALRAGGITTDRPPIRFADRSFRRSATARDPGRRDRPDATVVVWPDSFTDAFDPGLGHDVVALLEAAGERVAIPSGWGCCGRPLYDSGMLGVARGWLGRLVAVLDPWTSRGIPVVVPEPSCLSAFRDELPNLLADDPRALRLAQLARSPAEHLLADGRVDRLQGASPTPGQGRRLVIHPHCQGRAVRATDADAELARRLGFEATVLDGGCCGLAGSFGFRAEHEPVSRTIGTQHWLPALEDAMAQAGDATLVIDGFSCRTQLDHLGSREATTLAAALLDVLVPPATEAP
jgi:FAD/FMN-containing dehydrogenase/Fe-S oxidoreductase